MATQKQKLNRMKQEAIVYLYARGYSFSDIAKVFRVTRQWVFMIAKKRLDKKNKGQ